MEMHQTINQEGPPYVNIGVQVSSAVFVELPIPVNGVQQNTICLDLSYDLAGLEPLSVLLCAMVEKKIAPLVYVWDLGRLQAQMSIVFRLRDPDVSVLEKLETFTGANLAAANRVIARAEVTCPSADMRDLLYRFDLEQRMIIIVSEVGTGRAGDMAPLSAFEVREVRRHPPTPQ